MILNSYPVEEFFLKPEWYAKKKNDNRLVPLPLFNYGGFSKNVYRQPPPNAL